MPTLYDVKILPNIEYIRAWIRDGISEENICNKLKISKAAWDKYKQVHPDFNNVIKCNKDYVDLVEVVGAFKQRATGYTVEEEEEVYNYVFDPVTKENTEVLVGRKVKKKHIPPDTQALLFWLRMRQPEMWKDNTPDALEGCGKIVVIPAREPITIDKSDISVNAIDVISSQSKGAKTE